MEVETETSEVCLWDIEGTVNLTGLCWDRVGPVMEGWLPKRSLFSGASQHSRMIGKILSTKWIVLVIDFPHFLLFILLFLLLLKGDPSANDHS